MIRPVGSWVAIVTPFTTEDEVDYAGFEKLVDFQAQNGTNGIMIMGSTGEPTMLSMAERREIIERVVPYCKGKVPVFVGTTCGSTKETVELSKHAAANGADGLVLVVPPYAGPPQDGIYAHFKAVAESVEIAVAIYNNPSRVSVNIDPPTVIKLAQIPNIVADKEAMPNVGQLADIIRGTNGKFNMLCCDAPGYSLILPILAMGGHGTANVSGNVIPREMAQLSRPWKSFDDVTKARELYFKVLPMLQGMYSSVNPVAVKAALRILGLPAGHVRSPLQDMQGEKLANLERIIEAMEVKERYGL